MVELFGYVRELTKEKSTQYSFDPCGLHGQPRFTRHSRILYSHIPAT